MSAKARRKRKQQEAEQPTAATAVAWANAKVQQRVFGDAWLAFLRTDLPADIYRKVGLPSIVETYRPIVETYRFQRQKVHSMC